MSRWVVDTGPLIFLAKLDRLELLQRGVDEILVPGAVLAEVHFLNDEAAQKIEAAGQSWLQVQTIDDRSKMRLLLKEGTKMVNTEPALCFLQLNYQKSIVEMLYVIMEKLV